MDIKNKYIWGLFVVAFVSSIVYAATLIEKTEVLSCGDSDGGLNYFVAGNVSGKFYNTTSNQTQGFLKFDFCVNNITIGEYACNNNIDPLTRELWYENCTAVNGTSCSLGRCV